MIAFAKIKPLLYIFALLGAFAAGSYVEDLRQTNAALKKEQELLTDLNERKDQIDDLNQRLYAAQSEAAMQYEKGRQEAQTNADSLISEYRSGNIRLRKELQCSNDLLRGVSDATTTGRLAVPEGNCGLSSTDVENLVRFAAETNRLRDKVNSLISAYNQAKIEIDRLNHPNKETK